MSRTKLSDSMVSRFNSVSTLLLEQAMYAEEQEAERKERASRDSHKGLT